MGVPSPRTPREATITRDTLAKGIYERNFASIVASVNAALVPDTSRGSADDEPQRELFIGLLDIFGSEIFPTNGFEQVRALMGPPQGPYVDGTPTGPHCCCCCSCPPLTGASNSFAQQDEC